MGFVIIRYQDGTEIVLGDHPDQKPGWHDPHASDPYSAVNGGSDSTEKEPKS